MRFGGIGRGLTVQSSYVFYLENRVAVLELLLRSHDIRFPAAESLESCSQRGAMGSVTVPAGQPTMSPTSGAPLDDQIVTLNAPLQSPAQAPDHKRKRRSSGPTTPAPTRARSGTTASNVAFAKVVLAAVHHSYADNGKTHKNAKSSKPRPAPKHSSSSSAGTSMRDSFFGLHTKSEVKLAPFPKRSVGLALAQNYFNLANPQNPILHRGDFMHMFELAYSAKAPPTRGSRELYMLNMVFAIGSGCIVKDAISTVVKQEPLDKDQDDHARGFDVALDDSSVQAQPEEYHASAVQHFEACLGSNDGLVVLQAMLLLANFALLRPVPPGLWYISGACMRLAIDLGLYYEDGMNHDDDDDADSANFPEMANPPTEPSIATSSPPPPAKRPTSPSKMGHQLKPKTSTAPAAMQGRRRQYVRDMRRRLWWCTYALDRLVSTCVGRPFGISDLVVTTEFPSLLDDDYISPTHGLQQPSSPDQVSYKRISYHYFRLRLLQSEILHVLQYSQAMLARERSRSRPDATSSATFVVSTSPFLARFASFRDWRIDIDQRLWEWKQGAPSRTSTAVSFSTDYLELNYWQAVLLLYRHSLGVPAMFEGEYSSWSEVNSPTGYPTEQLGDQDAICLKVSEAGQETMQLYGRLNMDGLVSYSYLATHHLFMAGISYLYSIWHSSAVRSRLVCFAWC